MRIRTAAITATAALIVPGHALAASTAVLIGRGDCVEEWAPSNGQAVISTSVGATAPWSGLPYLNFTFNFSGGGWQTSVQPADSHAAIFSVPEQRNLTLAVFLPLGSPANCINVGVTDAEGTGFGSCTGLVPGWQNLSIALVTSSFWSNGKNLTLPLQSLTLGASNKAAPGPGPSGWLGLADVALVSGAAPGGIPAPVFHLLVQPLPSTSGVLVAGDTTVGPVSVGTRAVNRLPVTCTANITVEARNASGALGGGGANDGVFGGVWTPCASVIAPLQPWETVSLLCTVDPAVAPAGWLTMRSTFAGSDCWTVNDTGPQVVEGAIALVLPQPVLTPVTRNVNPGVFGGQMLPSAAAAAVIGMRTVRSGPLWEWSQPNECWNASTCFDWSFYDDIFSSSAAGIEVMIDARELPPPWARAKNDSGGAWSEIPGPDHYADYQRWLTLMLARYAPMATSVEVSNENDGYAYFANDKLPLGYDVNLSLSLINITAAAIAETPEAAGVALMGLSSSMFDVAQCGNGGTQYLYYERTILNSPGVMTTLSATTFHPYAPGVWVPWAEAPWGNTTFFFPNQTNPNLNSTVAMIKIMAGLMTEAAAAAGIPPPFTPAMHPSEMGYNLLMRNAAGSGWTVLHAALVSHLLIHLRSQPVAQWVHKAFLFAAYDGCCAESDGFFGIWRPALLRSGPGAQGDIDPSAVLSSSVVPLAGVAAFATASALIDVPSGRLPGVFIVDHSGGDGSPPYLPSCVAFEPDPASPVSPPPRPLVVVMTTAHHYNDAIPASLRIETAAPPPAVSARNGLGAPLALAVSGSGPGWVALNLSLGALPQFLELPADASAVAVCATLSW